MVTTHKHYLALFINKSQRFLPERHIQLFPERKKEVQSESRQVSILTKNKIYISHCPFKCLIHCSAPCNDKNFSLKPAEIPGKPFNNFRVLNLN